MKSKLGENTRLIERLIPDFGVGCRRPTPGNGYLEALCQENVTVITDEIQKISEDGIVLTTGDVLSVDVIICATGFDISFSPRFPLIGREGLSLSEHWQKTPEAYLSLAVEHFPNYFSKSLVSPVSNGPAWTPLLTYITPAFLGPNSPVGHGSVIPLVEHAAKYIINILKRFQTEQIRTIAPSGTAVRDFNEHTREFMKRTAWKTSCRSWFKNGTVDGPVVALHPGSRLHWLHMLDEVRYEDYEITYCSRNRFAYLGNGFSVREAPGLDTTWYLDDPEYGYKAY